MSLHQLSPCVGGRLIVLVLIARKILAPSDEAFEKIPYTSLKLAFENNDETVITNVLSYHILQGTRMAADLVPGTPVFIPTLLTDPLYSSVTGGQRVGNVKQAGNVVVFTSGQGSRSTLVQAVWLSISKFKTRTGSNASNRISNLRGV